MHRDAVTVACPLLTLPVLLSTHTHTHTHTETLHTTAHAIEPCLLSSAVTATVRDLWPQFVFGFLVFTPAASKFHCLQLQNKTRSCGQCSWHRLSQCQKRASSFTAAKFCSGRMKFAVTKLPSEFSQEPAIQLVLGF